MSDAQVAALCAAINPVQANQQWGWKGEWWMYGGTSIYLHTVPPNRVACDYTNDAQDQRAASTAVNASSLHSGGVNCLLMDGSVKFVKNSVSSPVWVSVATPTGVRSSAPTGGERRLAVDMFRPAASSRHGRRPLGVVRTRLRHRPPGRIDRILAFSGSCVEKPPRCCWDCPR